MNFPERFHVGIRQVTIPNPAHLHRNNPAARTFQGLCSDYNFEKQTENYIRLRNVLRDSGTDFLYVASSHSRGDLHTNHRFVACSTDGSLLWNKYVAFVAQGGQNHVYVGGMRIKVSTFLGLQQHEQRALLGGHRSIIELTMDPKRMKYLNEDKTLWN
jgi:hypothetical protein